MRVLLSSSITNRCAQAKDVAQSRTCQEKRAFRDSSGALQRAAELGRQRQASLSGTVKKLSWRERWRGYIRATKTALFAALLVGALTAGGDMIIVGLLLCAALLVGIIAIISDPSVYLVKNGVLGTVLVIGLARTWGFIYYHNQDHPIPEALLSSQIEEMRKIEKLIDVESEIEIRRIFDIFYLVSYNMRLLRRDISPSLVSKEQSDDIDRYFVDSISLVNSF